MCWIATNNFDIVKHIATDNIPVTKIVNFCKYGGIYSYYNNFPYGINALYKLNKPFYKPEYIDSVGRYIISEGFHSYSTKIRIKVNHGLCGIIIYDIMFNDFNLASITKACNSDTIAEPAIAEPAIADCIIPKGSVYCLNSRGEYVSDSIKIINVYKIK